MRQKRYPYKRLTETAKVSAVKACATATLKTINSLLFFNIRDYAQAVFDYSEIANTIGETNPFKVQLNGLNLVQREMEVPKKPMDKIIEITKEEQVSVVEGWGNKYKAANIGFGIAVGLLIVAILTLCLLFHMNYRKLKVQREKIDAL